MWTPSTTPTACSRGRRPASEPAPPVGAGLGYQPALDGVRAFAVLAVMLYHGDVSWAPGGFLGVDVFFVLSGFLITTLLVQEWQRDGRIARGRFWARRARRLLPALFLVLVGVAIYAAALAGSGELARIRRDGLASLLYVQNWNLIATSQSYFAQFGAPSPLRHMWSLAIEEQWYLVWPLLLPLLLGARPRGGVRVRAFVATLALAAASAVLMVVLYRPGHDPSRVYYGTDTRAQALLLGAALSFVWLYRPHPRARLGRVWLQAAGLAGVMCLGWMVARTFDTSPFEYRGGLTLAAVASVAVIGSAMSPGPLRSVLALPPLPAIGRISYGLYIWHWPVYVALTPSRVGTSGWSLLAARFGVTFAVSIASYVLVERPVRRGVGFPLATRVALPAGAVLCAVALVVATIPTVNPANPANPANAATVAPSTPHVLNPLLADLQMLGPGRVREMPVPRAPATAVSTVVAGDSVAYTLGAEGAPTDPHGIDVLDIAILGCGVALGTPVIDGRQFPPSSRCDMWPGHDRAAVSKRNPDLAVLLIGAWEMFDRDVDGHRITYGTPGMARYLDRQLDLARSILTARGAFLVLLTVPCYDPAIASLGTPDARERVDPARVAWFNRLLRAYAHAHPADVALVDLHGYVCPHGKYAESLDGVRVRSDGVHFTPSGAALVWRWLTPELLTIAGAHRRAPAERG